MGIVYAMPSRAGLVSLPADASVKLQIIHAVERPVEHVTVQEICAVCGIARSTFYNHFASKLDMYPWLMTQIMERTIDQAGVDRPLEGAVSSFLDYVAAEMPFVHLAAGTIAGCDAIGQHRRSALAHALEQLGVNVDARIRALISLHVETEYAFLRQWVRGSLPNDVPALTDLFLAATPSWLSEALASQRPGRKTA